MLQNISKEFLNRFMLELIKASSKKEKVEKREIRPIRPMIGLPIRMSPRQIPIAMPAARASVIAEERVVEEEKIQPPQLTQKPLMIDLGRINLFIEDKTVSIIECPGPEKNIKVTKEGAVVETGVSLSDEEIKGILNKISSRSSVPLGPVFNASIMGLTINAMISEIIGSRFTIKKQS